MSGLRRGLALLAVGAALVLGAAPSRADCGPGAVVTSNGHDISRQSVAFSTNITLLPTQLLAITFGTSGCSNSGVIYRDQEQQVFVAYNYSPLLQEMAQGQGSRLDALASLLGCAPEQERAIGQWTQSRFATLLPAGADQPAVLLTELKRGMRAYPPLAACSRLG